MFHHAPSFQNTLQYSQTNFNDISVQALLYQQDKETVFTVEYDIAKQVTNKYYLLYTYKFKLNFQKLNTMYTTIDLQIITIKIKTA